LPLAPRFFSPLFFFLFLHNVLRGRRWAKRGQRPAFCANAGRDRYSVLGGDAAVDGACVGLATVGTLNAQTVCDCVDAREAAFPEAERITVYTDSARYFHARRGKASLADKRVRFVYLPAYSPNLNLIERLWKFCKKVVLGQFYARFTDFTAAIDAFFANLTRYRDELATLMTDKFELFTRR
jgi:hypothetical protein